MKARALATRRWQLVAVASAVLRRLQNSNAQHMAERSTQCTNDEQRAQRTAQRAAHNKNKVQHMAKNSKQRIAAYRQLHWLYFTTRSTTAKLAHCVTGRAKKKELLVETEPGCAAPHNTPQHCTACRSIARTIAQHDTAQHSPAQHDTQHDIARHSTAWHTARHSTARHGAAWHGPQHDIARRGMAWHGTQLDIVQHGIALHGMAHSTA
eukprot:353350-Chlamydomonas_euryale.AAC.1